MAQVATQPHDILPERTVDEWCAIAEESTISSGELTVGILYRCMNLLQLVKETRCRQITVECGEFREVKHALKMYHRDPNRLGLIHQLIYGVAQSILQTFECLIESSSNPTTPAVPYTPATIHLSSDNSTTHDQDNQLAPDSTVYRRSASSQESEPMNLDDHSTVHHQTTVSDYDSSLFAEGSQTTEIKSEFESMQRTVVCILCQQSLESFVELEQHTVYVHDKTMKEVGLCFECLGCRGLYESAQLMKQHMADSDDILSNCLDNAVIISVKQKEHSDGTVKKKNPPSSSRRIRPQGKRCEKQFRCPICEMTASTPYGLLRHFGRFHRSMKRHGVFMKCSRCALRIRSTVAMARHNKGQCKSDEMKIYYDPSLIDNNDDEDVDYMDEDNADNAQYICTICQKRLRSVSSFYRHVQSAHKTTLVKIGVLFDCDQCKKELHSYGDIYNHRKSRCPATKMKLRQLNHEDGNENEDSSMTLDEDGISID